jgi:c-di-AMP phosphodiesterase-like protein
VRILFALIIIFASIFIVVYLIVKKRLKWRYILAFLLVIIGILMIRNRIYNKIFFDFKNDLKKEFSYISNITVTDIDPNCYLDVYLKSKNYSYGEVEQIFIEIMLALSDETIYNYFEQRHNKNANGEPCV